MTLADPLALVDFAEVINIDTAPFILREAQQYSGLGSGQILGADLGPRLWTADVTLFPAYDDDALAIQGLFESLDGVSRSFFLCDPRALYPRADPDGTLLGAATPTIHALGGDNKSMRLAGLPAGYPLSGGDFLSFDYGAPSRRAFHRIVEDAAADESGITPLFEVRPHIRPGAMTGLGVALVKPAARMVLAPGSLRVSKASDISRAMSFSAIQRL